MSVNINLIIYIYLINYSEQIGLFHDPIKFIFTDFSITVSVCLIDHFLYFFIGHILPQFLCYPLQIFERNFASFIIIKKPECLGNFISWIFITHFLCHHIAKLIEINNSAVILICISDHFENFIFFRFKSKGSHCHFEFFLIDSSTAICVEQIKGFFDFLFLFFIHLGPCFWTI